MGVIEDRLAELVAQKPPRALHQWRPIPKHDPFTGPYTTGDYECPLCGGWMSGLKDPSKYREGCPGTTEKENA